MGQTHALGVTSGVNLARANGYYNKGFQAGPLAGLSYQLRFAKKLFFGADVIYDSRGGKGSAPNITDGGQLIRNMTVSMVQQYVSIPLKFGMISQGRFFGFGNAGLIPSYLVNAKYRVGQSNSDSEWHDMTHNVNKFDVGLLLEGGAGVKLSSRVEMLVAVGFQRGLLNVYNDGIPSSYVHQYAFSGALTCRYIIGVEKE